MIARTPQAGCPALDSELDQFSNAGTVIDFDARAEVERGSELDF
jgi:hypothetical protein